MSSIVEIKGFNDILPTQTVAWRRLEQHLASLMDAYGYQQIRLPIVEQTGLFKRAIGDATDIVEKEMYTFFDKGNPPESLTLRPEGTAGCVRALVEHNLLRGATPRVWYMGPMFRYEKPQKGRGREFFQFNVDLLGESSAVADAELLSVAIDTMRAFGFEKSDYQVRVSDRQAWADFAKNRGLNEEQLATFLQIVDKLERDKTEVLQEKLGALGLTLDEVKEFIANPDNASATYRDLLANLTARGLGEFIRWDLSIVRGLAYYTGLVFEVFDARASMRAVAGGGRYDTLVSTISDGKVSLPATGFAMGDYVIRNLIEETPHTLMQMEVWLQRNQAGCDVYVAVDQEEKRNEALRLVTELRTAGLSVDYPMTAMKFNKQLQRADQAGARFALVVGQDFPTLKLKMLASRAETTIAAEGIVEEMINRIHRADGPLLA
jgi:histidyl-tRNA synthetase